MQICCCSKRPISLIPNLCIQKGVERDVFYVDLGGFDTVSLKEDLVHKYSILASHSLRSFSMITSKNILMS